MTISPGAVPHEYYLFVDGQRWPCAPGDVLGRAGTVAVDFLRPVQVLSRRHLMIEQRGEMWYAVALPEARNETYLNGLPMQRGIPYPLSGLQNLQVDSFHFQLGPAQETAPVPAWEPSPAYGFALPVRQNPADETHPTQAGLTLSELPAATVETDLRLHVLNANPAALALLGEHAAGRDLDEWAPERTRIRDCLLSLDDGGLTGPVDVVLTVPGGQPLIELQASRAGSRLYIQLRDVTLQRHREQNHQQLADRLASQTALLAELSLSRAFQEGDVAKSLTILAHRAAAVLHCRRVSAWLKPEAADADARKVICQVCHDTAAAAKSGTATDLAYCPMFFDALATDHGPSLWTARRCCNCFSR